MFLDFEISFELIYDLLQYSKGFLRYIPLKWGMRAANKFPNRLYIHHIMRYLHLICINMQIRQFCIKNQIFSIILYLNGIFSFCFLLLNPCQSLYYRFCSFTYGTWNKLMVSMVTNVNKPLILEQKHSFCVPKQVFMEWKNNIQVLLLILVEK